MFLDRDMFKKLFMAIVWCYSVGPSLEEKRRAFKQIPGLAHLTFRNDRRTLEHGNRCHHQAFSQEAIALY